jgi:4-amino-4-deoxy-L-arabinose transferase-like glycosyltransferase
MDGDMIAAIVVLTWAAIVLAFRAWKHRNEQGFWARQLEEAQRRQKNVVRHMWFVGSLVGLVTCPFFALQRDPIWYWSGTLVCAIIAYLCRPQWMRRKPPVKAVAQNQDTPSESN